MQALLAFRESLQTDVNTSGVAKTTERSPNRIDSSNQLTQAVVVALQLRLVRFRQTDRRISIGIVSEKHLEVSENLQQVSLQSHDLFISWLGHLLIFFLRPLMSQR